MYPDRTFFSLQRFVYPFVWSHWNLLALDTKKTDTKNWKKLIINVLNDKKDLFTSGQQYFHHNGYWALKSEVDLRDLINVHGEKRPCRRPQMMTDLFVAPDPELQVPPLSEFVRGAGVLW